MQPTTSRITSFNPLTMIECADMSDRLVHPIVQHLEMLKMSCIDVLASGMDTKKRSALQPKGAEGGFSTLKETVEQCTLCQELASKRTRVVFGAGNPHAQLVFVGEAPGYDED